MEAETYLEKLRTAMGLVETLKAERDAFKVNFEKLRDNHDVLQSQVDTLLNERDTLARERETLEQDNEELLSHLKTVESKAKELEELRSQLVSPKDVEKIRSELTQKHEETQKKNFEMMSEETQKYRKLYFELKKSHELTKTELERATADHDNIVKEMTLVHQGETEHLRRKVESLEKTLESASESNRVRQLIRDNHELSGKCNALTREIEDLRAKYELDVATLSQQDRLSQRKLVEEAALTKTLQSEKEALQSKIASLEDQLHAALKSQENAAEENRKLSQKLAVLKSRHDEAVHNFNIECGNLKVNAVKEKSEHASQMNEMRVKQSELQSQVKNLNQTVNELRLKLSNAEKDLAEKVRLAKEEEWAKIERLEREKEDIQAKFVESRQKKNELEMQLEHIKKATSVESGRLQKDTLDLNSRLEQLAAQVRQLDAEREGLKTQLVSSQTRAEEFEGRATDFANRLEQHRNEEASLREQLLTVEGLLDNARNDLQATTDMLSKERESYLHNLERLKSNWTKEQYELQILLKSLESENIELKERFAELDRQSQQQITTAKKQFKILKTKAGEYKLMAENSKLELDNLKKQLDVAKMKQEAQTREMKYRQKEFMSLLQSELLSESVQ